MNLKGLKKSQAYQLKVYNQMSTRWTLCESTKNQILGRTVQDSITRADNGRTQSSTKPSEEPNRRNQHDAGGRAKGYTAPWPWE